MEVWCRRGVKVRSRLLVIGVVAKVFFESEERLFVDLLIDLKIF